MFDTAWYNEYNKKFSGNLYDFKKKALCVKNYITYMLDRTTTMFEYENLPKTIDKRILELFLQTAGQVAFYKYKDNLYFFVGSGSGKPDYYYRSSQYVIVNPALDLSKTVDIYYGDNEIKDDMCVVMRNDSLTMGLIPLCRKYASLLTENDLSLKIASINARAMSVFVAGDDNTAISAKEFMRQLEAGNGSAITSNFLSDSDNIVQNVSAAASNTITNLIELEQYLKASWFNELGLNANYNMKRESLNSEESQMNFDALLPFVDDMLDERERAVELINEYFGTNISVHLHGAWRALQEEHAMSDENVFEEEETMLENEEMVEQSTNNEEVVENEDETTKTEDEINEREEEEKETVENVESEKNEDETIEESVEETAQEAVEAIAQEVLEEIVEAVKEEVEETPEEEVVEEEEINKEDDDEEKGEEDEEEGDE